MRDKRRIKGSIFLRFGSVGFRRWFHTASCTKAGAIMTGMDVVVHCGQP